MRQISNVSAISTPSSPFGANTNLIACPIRSPIAFRASSVNAVAYAMRPSLDDPAAFPAASGAHQRVVARRREVVEAGVGDDEQRLGLLAGDEHHVIEDGIRPVDPDENGPSR